MSKVGRPRRYPTNAKKQAAYRLRQQQQILSQIPVVRGEGYTLYQGDALALVPLVGPFDHCITDPPYEAEAHTRTRRTRAVLEGRAVYADIDFAPITEPQRRLFGRLQCRWMLIFCQAEAIGRYQQVLGLKYRQALEWNKPDSAPQFTGDRPAIGHESIVCAWGLPGRSRWNGGGKRGVYTHAVRDAEPRLGPTQKPLALMRELVRDFTQPGDVVLDPFMGSATTGLACLEEGRRFIGIEQDPQTFQVACHRLATAATQGRLFAATPPPRQAALLSLPSRAPMSPGPGAGASARGARDARQAVPHPRRL